MEKENGLSSTLKRRIGKVRNYVALAIINPKLYQKINLGIIRNLIQKEKTPGLYVTLNKPFEVMFNLFKKENIDTDMIIFIDAVTRTAGGNIEKSKNCLYIGNPEDLSDISLAMDQAISGIPTEEKFLFFDSLDTLLIYNKPITVAKFVHFLAGKMRVWKVKGIIISLSTGSNKELIDELSQFCDVRLEL